MNPASLLLNPNTKPQVQTASSSQSRLIHFSHTWTIDNFSHRFDSSSKSHLQSGRISFSPEDKQAFVLRMYPNGKSEESEGHLSLFLLNSNFGNSWPVVGCKFAILNDKGNKCNVQEEHKKIYSNQVDSLKEMGFEKYIPIIDLFEPSNGLLTSNKLTIYVEISYLADQWDTVSSSYIPIGSAGENRALKDYENLLKSGKLSDVVLVVSGVEFRAHKLVLSARSPVFCAMFEHDLMEKQQNRVEIIDVKPDVFQQLLSYIYSGKCDSIEGNAEKLLVAADKYQLIELKSNCELYLRTKVSVESAPNLLLLADSFNAHKLKAAVLDFIKRQSNETFQAMVKANPELLLDMFRYLAIKSEQLELLEK